MAGLGVALLGMRRSSAVYVQRGRGAHCRKETGSEAGHIDGPGVAVIETIDAGTVEWNPDTARYADIAIHLPAYCETCHCRLDEWIYIADGRTYCREHTPLVKDHTSLPAGNVELPIPPLGRVPLPAARGDGI